LPAMDNTVNVSPYNETTYDGVNSYYQDSTDNGASWGAPQLNKDAGFRFAIDNMPTNTPTMTPTNTPTNTATNTPGVSCSLGMTVAGTTNSPPGSYNNTIFASGFNLASASTAYTVSLYCPFGGTNARVAIYNGTAFVATTKIVESGSQAVTAGWNTFDIVDTP